VAAEHRFNHNLRFLAAVVFSDAQENLPINRLTTGKNTPPIHAPINKNGPWIARDREYKRCPRCARQVSNSRRDLKIAHSLPDNWSGRNAKFVFVLC